MNTKKSKSKQLHIAISPESLNIIDSKARAAAMKRSEYIRQTALNCPIEVPPIPTDFLTALCRMSNILTQNHNLDTKNARLLREEVEHLWQSLNL